MSDARHPRALLQELDVKPHKARGQNFLLADHMVEKIVQFGKPDAGDRILEIGPGLGALTRKLGGGASLTLVEIEPKFCRYLEAEFPNARVIESDVREFEIESLGAPLVVFGNLPYSFSSEIVFKLLDSSAVISRAVLLLQKEFVERLAADPGGKDYGTISVSAQYQAELRTGPKFPGTCFHPAAEVDSMLVELKMRPEPVLGYRNAKQLRRTVRSAFAQRRKKIHNSMRSTGYFSGAAIDAALAACEIDSNRRAETLSVEEFVRLARALDDEAATVPS